MLRSLTIVVLLIGLTAAPTPGRAEASAPFDPNLQRLAEIMGALHYLRALCGANEGPKWRNEIQALIDAEAASGGSAWWRASTEVTAPSSRPTAPALRRLISSSVGTLKKVPRSRVTSQP